jgi:hypothetical protein
MFETTKLCVLPEVVVFGREVSLFTLTGSSLFRGLLFQLIRYTGGDVLLARGADILCCYDTKKSTST